MSILPFKVRLLKTLLWLYFETSFGEKEISTFIKAYPVNKRLIFKKVFLAIMQVIKAYVLCLNMGTDEKCGGEISLVTRCCRNSWVEGHHTCDPRLLSPGERDRDHLLADRNEGPRVQPAHPTDCVSIWMGPEGEWSWRASG